MLIDLLAALVEAGYTEQEIDVDCCGGSSDEVRKCAALKCPSWPFRLGASPWKAARQLSDEQRDALRERGRSLAARRGGSAADNDKLPSAGAGTGVAATPAPEPA